MNTAHCEHLSHEMFLKFNTSQLFQSGSTTQHLFIQRSASTMVKWKLLSDWKRWGTRPQTSDPVSWIHRRFYCRAWIQVFLVFVSRRLLPWKGVLLTSLCVKPALRTDETTRMTYVLCWNSSEQIKVTEGRGQVWTGGDRWCNDRPHLGSTCIQNLSAAFSAPFKSSSVSLQTTLDCADSQSPAGITSLTSLGPASAAGRPVWGRIHQGSPGSPPPL